MTLQWTLFELARAPSLQEKLRAELSAAKAASQGDVLKILKSLPLLKAVIKETLRWVGNGGGFLAGMEPS